MSKEVTIASNQCLLTQGGNGDRDIFTTYITHPNGVDVTQLSVTKAEPIAGLPGPHVTLTEQDLIVVDPQKPTTSILHQLVDPRVKRIKTGSYEAAIHFGRMLIQSQVGGNLDGRVLKGQVFDLRPKPAQ